MDNILGIYVTTTLVSAVMAAVVAVFAFRRRHVPGATALAAMMVAATYWCAAYAGELLASSEVAKDLWARSEYFGIALIGPCWLLFCLRYTGKLTRTSLWKSALFILPLVSVVAALGGTHMGLMWTSAHMQTFSGVDMYVVIHGPWFWVNVAYDYACLLIGAVVLLTTVLSEVKPLTAQGVVLVLAVATPWIANFLTLFWAGPQAGLDLTPFAIALSGALAALSLSRYGALQVFPAMVTIARDAVIQGMRDGVLVVGRGGVVLSTNRAAETLLGVRPGESAGRNVEDFFGQLPEFAQSSVSGGGPREYSFETTLGSEDAPLYVEVVASPLAADPRNPGLVLSMRDVTERHMLQEELEHKAMHDDLTGLPNRGLLRAHLRELLALQRREGGELALLMIDLDRFKEINDTFGHAAGDVVLQAAALRLREALRESDLVARLGGDEFAVILPGGGSSQAMTIAAGLREMLADPVESGRRQLRAGASVGVAVAPRDGDTSDLLMQHADVALYMAKDRAQGVALYDPELDPNSAEILELINEVRKALEEDQLRLRYQPVVGCRDEGAFSRVEAQPEWTRPDGSVLRGAELSTLVARCGMLERLTGTALYGALTAVRTWDAAGWRADVAVDLSTEDLRDADIVQRVRTALATHDVEPARLWLEVPEASVTVNLARARVVLSELRAVGVHVSIDGFGVGLSSLTSVRTLPADELKIDRSLAFEIETREESQAIVRAVVALGHDLGLAVAVNGVEDETTLAVVRSLGADAVQGTAVAPPMTAAELLAAADGAPAF